MYFFIHIKNLEFILGVKENENDKEDPNYELLLNIYKKALNYKEIDEQICKKREIIKKDLQLLPYNQVKIYLLYLAFCWGI